MCAYLLLESGRSLKLNDGLSCDLDLGAGCGVDTRASCALNGREGTEANESHFVTCLNCTCDCTEGCIKSLFCVCLAQACLSSDSAYQFCFVHDKTAFKSCLNSCVAAKVLAMSSFHKFFQKKNAFFSENRCLGAFLARLGALCTRNKRGGRRKE